MDIKTLQKKVDLYEKFMKEMKELDNIQDNNNILGESMIIEKDNNGNTSRKVPSDLTESFLVIDHAKNLSELNKKEQKVILEQDSYHNYKKTSDNFNKAKGIYSVAYYALSFGKWFLLL